MSKNIETLIELPIEGTKISRELYQVLVKIEKDIPKIDKIKIPISDETTRRVISPMIGKTQQNLKVMKLQIGILEKEIQF